MGLQTKEPGTRARESAALLGQARPFFLMAMSATIIFWSVAPSVGSAEQVPSDPAVVTGTVMDSTRMAPLEGAEIQLLGTDHTVLSEADGSYRMEVASPGRHELHLSHPRLLELGLDTLPSWEIVVADGDIHTQDLAIPGWATLGMWQCGQIPAGSGLGVISGVVVSAGTRDGLEGVTVQVARDPDPDARRDARGQDERWEVTTGPEGRFVVCDLPVDISLYAVVSVAGIETSPQELRLGSDEAEVLTLQVGTSEAGILRGTVEQGGDGEPIEAAQVRVRGPEGLSEILVTDRAGGFILPEAPSGAYQVEVAHLAYRDLDEPLRFDVVGGQMTNVTVRLLRDAIALDPIDVEVEAQRPTWGPLVEIYDRKERFERLGLGRFIGRDVLDGPGSHRLSRVIAGRTPGVRLVGTGVSSAGVRIHRVNDCEPSIYVDGIRTGGMGVDDFWPHQVEMVEIYRGISQLPGEMADNNALRCGAIGIWTRRGH